MRLFPIFIFLILVASCDKLEVNFVQPASQLMEIPKGFPEVSFPEDNGFTEARWELGKRIFYDPILSSDQSISCGSCHQPSLAFSDDVSVSLGVENRPGTRNSPSLSNVAYHPYFTREGGVPTLEMQVLVPIQEHNEFDFNIVLAAERLNEINSYVEQSMEAYGEAPSPFVITRAVATFERSLLSGNSDYDKFHQQEDMSVLSVSQQNGMDLFFGDRAQCSGCHSGFNFTDYSFENNGLYDKYLDPGRFRLTGEESDRGRFKVPSLRNVEVTGPYMHDGSVYSLEEVIDHYVSGGSDHINQSELVQTLDLTENEQEDLLNFLKSLTDTEFLENPLFND